MGSSNSKPETKISVSILLMGKTGHGKSATGNSILGRKVFKTSSKAKSGTKKVSQAWAVHGHLKVKVVDGPGLEDTDLNALQNNEQACKNMAKAMMMCNGGVHAFVLVIKFPFRYTKEERTAISNLKQIFGENYFRERCILVITGGDAFLGTMEADGTPNITIQKWCREQTGEFASLIQGCSSRIVLFNNISKNEQEKTRQRDELLVHVVKLSAEKGVYTSKHFKAYEQVRAKLIEDGRLKVLEEKMQERIDLLSAELGRLSVNSTLRDIARLQARIEKLRREMGRASQQDGPLESLKNSLDRISSTTQELKIAIQEKRADVIREQLDKVPTLQRELDEVEEFLWEALFLTLGVGLVIVGGVTAVFASGGAALLALGAMATTAHMLIKRVWDS